MPSTPGHGTTDLRTDSSCLRWMRSSGSNDIELAPQNPGVGKSLRRLRLFYRAFTPFLRAQRYPWNRPSYPIRSRTFLNGYSGQGKDNAHSNKHNIIASGGLPLGGSRSRSWKTVGEGIQQSESYLFCSHLRTCDRPRIAES